MKPLVVTLDCVCPCHGNDGIKHVMACCCPHRKVVPADCPECHPADPADCIVMQEPA